MGKEFHYSNESSRPPNFMINLLNQFYNPQLGCLNIRMFLWSRTETPHSVFHSVFFFSIKLLNAFLISLVQAFCRSHPILVSFVTLTIFYENCNNEIPHYSVSQSSHFFLSWGQIFSLPPLLKQSHDTSHRMRYHFTIGIKNNKILTYNSH